MRWAARIMIGMWVALGVLAWAPNFGEAADATVTAIGRFVFRNYGGPQVLETGVRRARVELCDDDGVFGCALMGVGETDDDGYFSVTGRAGDFFGDLPDPLVKVIAQSGAGTVESASITGGVFCYRSQPIFDRPNGSTVNFGTITLETGVNCTTGGEVIYEDGAWEVHNLLVEAHAFMREFTLATPGRDVPPVKVRWPADRTVYDRPDFFSANGTIWMAPIVPAERFFFKQYAHHVLQHFADHPAPNYANGLCDDDTDIFGLDTGRCRWKAENGAISWTEGFPIFLSEVLTRFWGYEGFGTFRIGPGPHPHPDENFHLVPEVTATILWNLLGHATALGETVAMDPDGNNHDTNTSSDRVSVGFDTIWDVLVNYDPSSTPGHDHSRSIQEFWWGLAFFHPDLANRVSAVYHESHVNMLSANLEVNYANVTPTVVSRGGTVTVADTTANVGYVRVGETSITRLFLSLDTAFGAGDIQIGQRTVPSLMPNQGDAGSTPVTIPANVPYGTYYVIACADAPGGIFESSEQDNCMASGATVQVVAPAVAPGAPSALGQFRTDGSTGLPVGGWTNQTSVVLRFTMLDANQSDTLTPEVELKPVTTPFDGSGLRAGSAVPSSGAPVQGSVTVTGLTNGGKYHWRARVKDAGGQVSEWVSFGNNGETAADLAVDTAAPTGSVKIDKGAAWTDAPAVSLKLTCADGRSGCASMQLSNDNHTFTAPEPFAATRAWTLEAGDGAKTVYVRYLDRAGNVSRSYQDSITLDTVAPVVGAVIPTPSSIRPSLGESTTIRFPVSDQRSGSCSLKVRILGAAGFVAKTIDKMATCAPSGTTVSIVWDGKNGSGVPVPAATYFIEVTATDRAGNVGQASQGTVAVQ